MGTLTKCLTTTPLSAEDKQAIRDMVAESVRLGEDPTTATELAVEQILGEAEKSHQDIVSQVEKKGIPAKPREVAKEEYYQERIIEDAPYSDNFYKWAGGKDVRVLEPDEVNDYAYKADTPVVVKVFHGTTHKFDAFEAHRKGTMEGQFGQVNYFTSSEYDAEQNYAGEGPDLTNRIDRRAEQLEFEIQEVIDDEGLEAAVEQFIPGVDQFVEDASDIAYAMAREELSGGEGQTLELFVKVENPFVIGENAEWIDLVDNEAIQEQAIMRVAEDHNIEPSEVEKNIEEYENEVDEARWEIEADTPNKLIEAIQTVSDRHGVEAPNLADSVYDFGESARPEDIENLMRSSEDYAYAEGDMGELIGYQMIAEVIEEMGFDSIILRNAETRFKNMDMPQGTAHVHIFDSKNTNIKSVENLGAYDPSDPRILYQKRRARIQFPEDLTQGPSIISLMENADLSSFLHESGHFFFEIMTDIAGREGAPEGIIQDIQSLLDWFGVKDLATWQKMTVDERREHHEKFAEGFETYLFEGKSPNLEIQGLFQRFRAWLIETYRGIKSYLDPEKLTPEVRGVMDRMIATDAQIEAAEAVRAYRPLFESAEQAGMNSAEWERYQANEQKSHAKATEELDKRSLRDMKWLANAKGKELKRLQREAASKRKEARAEVAEEISKEPIYQALTFLKKGEMTSPDGEEIKVEKGHKLDIDILEEMFPKGELAAVDLAKLRGLKGKEGLHPDAVAEIFGFSSGDQLINAIFEAPPINDAIEAKTDQVMLERYGDITDPLAMERAAEEAIHNEARTRFVATELTALERLTGKKLLLTRAAKEYAVQAISSKKVRDAGRSAPYASAEARAAREAEKSLKKGNRNAAAQHKRTQLLNMYMFKESNKAKEEIDKTLRYLKKFDKKTTRQNIDPDALAQIDRFLEAFDLRKSVTQKELAARKSLGSWIKYQEEQGLEPIIDDALLGDLAKRHYSEVTLEEFRGLRDSIKNIEHLGRLKTKLLREAEKRRLNEVIEDAVSTITENAGKPIELDIETRLPQDRLAQGVDGYFASHRKFASFMRQMDGFKDGGSMWTIFTQPLNDASNKEAVMREKATERLAQIFKAYTAKDMRRMYNKEYIPGIGRSLTKQARLVIAFNWGNEGNRQRIKDGYGWNDLQMQEILNTLDKRDWDFVQSVLDFVNEYWADISAKEKRVTGIVPEKVESAPITTKYGTYDGGYFPLKYDDRQSPKAYADAAKEAAEQAIRGSYSRATTRRGHTKERAEKVERPVRLDFGVLFEHVDQVIHDLAFHEYLVDTNRILGSHRLQQAVIQNYGHEVLKQLQKTVTDVAAGDVPAQTQFESAINWIRTGTSIAAMGWNLGTAMLQPLGLSQSMVRIGPKYVMKGISRWMRDAASMENTTRWVMDRSDFMRLRGKTMQREINEIRNKVTDQSARRKLLGPAEDSYFWLILRAQLIADIPTWLGAYEKAMDSNESETRAIALADQAVIDSQGGGQIKDLAQIQRGGPLMKLWTNFYSYFSVTYNLTAESFRRTEWANPISVGRLAADMFLLYTAPAVLGWLMRDALIRGECDGGSDIECVAENLTREQLGYMLGTMVGMRELSSSVMGYYGYEGPAGVRGFSELGKVVKQVEQGELDEALIKSLNASAGIFLHYPAGQVQRTIDGIVSLNEGDTSNPMVLLTGKPKD